MSMPGIEEVIDQVIDKLKADMPAKVLALNAEYADVYLLSTPAETSYEIVFDKETAERIWSRGGYPAIIVEPLPEYVIGMPALDDEYAVGHVVQVSVVVNAADWRGNQIMLMRYLRAVKEILSAQNALVCGASRYRGGGFKSQFNLAKNEVLRDIAAVFLVTVYQRPS
jgi:hypothetical protein